MEDADFAWLLLSKSYKKQEFLTGDLPGLLESQISSVSSCRGEGQLGDH